MKRHVILLLFTILLYACTVKQDENAAEKETTFSIRPLSSDLGSSIRGMAIDSSGSLWMSGSSGKVFLLHDNDSLMDASPAGYEALDFRAIASLGDGNAIIVSAGTPAIILTTADFGKKWHRVYADSAENVFYNAIGFWNLQEGVVFGDPVNGRFTMLATADGGSTWTKQDTLLCPKAFENEAGFAASGTNLKLIDQSHIYYLTGGARSRMLFSADRGGNWLSFDLPIRQGTASEGGYSFDMSENESMMVVGGDYTEKDNGANAGCFSSDQGLTWISLDSTLHGYRSGVAYIDQAEWMAVGINGIDFSKDNGQNWVQLDTSFNLNVVTFVHPSFGYAAGKNVLVKIERE